MLYLKYLLIERRLARRTVAKATGINRTIISNITTGRMRPTADELSKLATYFNVPADKLVEHVSASPLGDGAEFDYDQCEKVAPRG